MTPLLTGMLLDDGGRGLARALATIGVVVVSLLFLAVFVPVAVLSTVFGGGGGPHTPPAGAPVVHPGQPPPAAPLAGPPGTVNLPPPIGSTAIEVARRYLGVRYVFGGSDPTIGLDCSGLVQLVFRQLGIWLPRTAQLQYNATARLTRDQLQPGDLVFFARTYADPHDWITHVGIYVGDGLQLNAPTEGQVVSIQPVFSGFWGAHFEGGGRVAPV
jgi:cell wall-associated NlpC family hydrolase